MLNIPYGISDFKSLIEDGYFYQDRTSYIETLENYGSKYFVYLRPRRFGKSLLLSTLSYYYGVQYKVEFESIFGKTFIGAHSTPNANSYLMIRFDFSGIDTTTAENTFSGILSNVKKSVSAFLTDYNNIFTKDQRELILKQNTPSETLKELFSCHSNNKIASTIYVLIDEYDHFANELISFNFSLFSDIVSKNGYVRKFYEVLKIATSSNQVERIFITGVSPITMDSLTSGFNIAKNITLSPIFHQMTGFDESEVQGILEGIDIPTDQVAPILNDMRLWYNGYLFNSDMTTKLYNPNMVLYFAQEYKDNKGYPKEMLDVNIASDYGKIQKLFNIQGREAYYFPILQALSENGEVLAPLTSQFSFEKEFSQDDLVSLLFYMGFLTIKSEEYGAYNFTFPNYAIKKLYAGYFLSMLHREAHLSIDNRPVNQAIITMAREGNPEPFFEQVNLILKHFSTRDAAHFNENSLKAIIISLLHQQSFFYIHSEYESDWQYMDIFLEATRGQKPNFEVAFELKYEKKGGKKLLENIFTHAFEQLKGYLQTPKFSARPNIKAWVVVVIGDKLHWKALKY